MWAVGALAVAVAVSPVYVSASHSLARLTARGAHRLIATQRGQEMLERLQGATTLRDRTFGVSELPGGRGTLRFGPGPDPRLAQVHLRITWQESGAVSVAEWTTLITR